MTDTLYFDGRCSICHHETKWIKRWAKDSLVLIDIHESINLPKEKSELLATLHLQTDSGKWLLGLDASVTAWKHTPVGFLFSPLRWPLIKSLADKLYSFWAKRRFCKLSYSKRTN